MAFAHRNDFVRIFAQHKGGCQSADGGHAAGGCLGTGQSERAVLPNFEVEVVSVRPVWSGASAEDVERSITVPLEQTLRTTDGLDKMTSTSSQA